MDFSYFTYIWVPIFLQGIQETFFFAFLTPILFLSATLQDFVFTATSAS